jgi:hypothetical protein
VGGDVDELRHLVQETVMGVVGDIVRFDEGQLMDHDDSGPGPDPVPGPAPQGTAIRP